MGAWESDQVSPELAPERWPLPTLSAAGRVSSRGPVATAGACSCTQPILGPEDIAARHSGREGREEQDHAEPEAGGQTRVGRERSDED